MRNAGRDGPMAARVGGGGGERWRGGGGERGGGVGDRQVGYCQTCM